MAKFGKFRDKYELNNNLENIIIENYSKENLENIFHKKIDYDLKPYYSYISSSKPRSSAPAAPAVNWGARIAVNTENAYVQPTSEEVERVLGALHMVQALPEDRQRQLVEATREIRYFFDGQVRARFGATQHFNAIRCLNNPETTDVVRALSIPGTQLAGEEFFALNRFMPNYPDVADIQWWSVYRDGSWRLDTWNPEGEHLDTGFNGWGNLVGSVLKLNGRVLTPPEMIALYRTLKLRNERGFMDERASGNLQTLMKALNTEGSLPRRYEEQLETAHDLGLVGEDGRTLTYVGRSMITPVTARQRKSRQLTETDEGVRRIILPTILN